MAIRSSQMHRNLRETTVFRFILTALLFIGLILATLRTYAQGAYARVASEAKLQVFPDSSLLISENPNSSGITNFVTQGGGSIYDPYSNDLSGGGITTGLVFQPQAENPSSPSYAAISAYFSPTYTLTNPSLSYLGYSFTYDLSFGSGVTAQPDGGSALATETVSVVFSISNSGTLDNFQQSLTQTNGSANDNPDVFHIGGSNGIAPGASVTFSVITSISMVTSYNPAVMPPPGNPPTPPITPEPGICAFAISLGMIGIPFLRRHRVA